MEEAEMGFVGETLDGFVQCGGKIVKDSVKGGEDVKSVGTETSLFAEILETIDSILNMPPIANDNIDGNSNTVDVEEMSNFVNDKFDANSNIFVDIIETINSILNMPIGNDKVDGNSNIVDEVLCGTEVEKCNAKEQIIADKDVSGVSATASVPSAAASASNPNSEWFGLDFSQPTVFDELPDSVFQSIIENMFEKIKTLPSASNKPEKQKKQQPKSNMPTHKKRNSERLRKLKTKSLTGLGSSAHQPMVIAEPEEGTLTQENVIAEPVLSPKDGTCLTVMRHLPKIAMRACPKK